MSVSSSESESEEPQKKGAQPDWLRLLAWVDLSKSLEEQLDILFEQSKPK